MRKTLITLKDGWSKFRGDDSDQWFNQSYTYLWNQERDCLHIRVETEAKIKIDWGSAYTNRIVLEYSTVLVKSQAFKRDDGYYNPVLSTQILALGRVDRDFYDEDLKSGAVDRWIKEAKKVVAPLIKKDIERYHKDGVDYEEFWKIGYGWEDYDKMFDEKLPLKTYLDEE